MASDDLLSRLGAVAREREQREHDPALQALVEGKSSAAEHVELAQRAALDPELAKQIELHTPLEDDVRRRIHASATASLNVRPLKPARRPRAHHFAAGATLAAAAAALMREPTGQSASRHAVTERPRCAPEQCALHVRIPLRAADGRPPGKFMAMMPPSPCTIVVPKSGRLRSER